MDNKKTLIIGASTNPERYAYKAAGMLNEYGYEFELAGIKKGEVFGKQIQNINDLPKFYSIHTVTLYIGPKHQNAYYDYIINNIQPKRVIFNPGTENSEFYKLLKTNRINYEIACSLVLLRTDQY